MFGVLGTLVEAGFTAESPTETHYGSCAAVGEGFGFADYVAFQSSQWESRYIL